MGAYSTNSMHESTVISGCLVHSILFFISNNCIQVKGKCQLQQVAKFCNEQVEQWKATIDLLCLNREEGHAEEGKIIRFIHGKSIVVFHCFSLLVADFCNLL